MLLTSSYRVIQAQERYPEPPETRAWIIGPDGQVYPCGNEHSECSRRYDVFKGKTYGMNLREGYTEIGKFENIVYLATRELNRASLIFLKELADKVLDDHGHADIMIQGESTVLKRSELVLIESVQDFFKIKNYLKRNRFSSRQAQWGNDGDFITPEAKVIRVGNNHSMFMEEHPEIFHGIVDPGEIVGEGWIRTRNMFRTFSIDARGGMTENQLRILQKMVRERCKYSDLRIEVAMNDGDVYQLTCDEFDEIEYPNQIKRRGLRSAAKAVPFITKNDLRLTREGDPWTDEDWLESGLKHLITVNGEHFSFTGKSKRDREKGLVFLYRAGRNDLWVGKDHKVYREKV